MTGGPIARNQADDGIHFRIVQKQDSDEVLQFLRKHFYPDEPLIVGSKEGHQDPEDEEFTLAQIQNATCIKAVQQHDDGERMVGVLLSGPRSNKEVKHLSKETSRCGSTNWGMILQILARAERGSNVFERYGVEQALHIHAIAVDGSLRGRAIGARLVEEAEKLARQLAYPLLTVDCTSLYSAKLCERLGMDCVNIIKYVDYLDDEGKVVYKPPQPHEYLKSYALKLE
ncbi:dopamine N-acetyltransferase [Ceratitis capitata]|uniref:aralkylamine N-acetyltransferase n=2 Tax=Ceratitis capitata TaxID=7213 RepID=A0A811V139_CERCA|nr:dopamine N-acetyltransferase [Ceratitis capitata]CAD7004664.1 unnamed protein product [Ceratitis capitata]